MNKNLLRSLNDKVKSFIKNHQLQVPPNLAIKPRAVGEAYEELMQDNFEELLGTDGQKYEKATRAKATADFSFYGNDGKYYAVDVKTHCIGKWGMPNLISYKKLDKFYRDSNNTFLVLLIDYEVTNEGNVVPNNVKLVPIEWISWDCLAVQGTLGQIQIKNAELVYPYGLSREEWIENFHINVRSSIHRKIRLLEKELEFFEVPA
jgi:hypothetical protein